MRGIKNHVRKQTGMLTFEGHSNIRQLLVLACMSQTDIVIRKVHAGSGGVADFEANLLRLFDKISNGSKIVLKDNGETIFFTPGVLQGGKIAHNCCVKRDASYYLEPIIWLSPFFKSPLQLTLTNAVTNGSTDHSVDFLKRVTLPLCRKFGIHEIDINIVNRSFAAPNDSCIGKVVFSLNTIVRQISSPFSNLKKNRFGHVIKVTGLAYSGYVSNTLTLRMVEAAKKVLLRYLPRVDIEVENYRPPVINYKKVHEAPNCGILLVCETDTGVMLVSEENMVKENVEEVGEAAAKKLLFQISQENIVDQTQCAMVFLFNAISEQKLNKMDVCEPNSYTIEMLRNIRNFIGVTFNIEAASKNLYSFSCLGTNMQNFNKKTM